MSTKRLHDEYKEIARAVLAHTAGLLALAEQWLRRADQLVCGSTKADSDSL